ncbi:MAG: hypothetical protein ACKOEO_15375 [Planctomycetaceae bacterium]
MRRSGCRSAWRCGTVMLEPAILNFRPLTALFGAGVDAKYGNSYHRGFDGRVPQIEGLEGLFINSTVAELRKTVNTGQIPLTSGSPTICNALNYMCNLYKVDFRGEEIASDGQ